MSTGLEPDLSRDEVLFSRFPIHRACRDGDIGALVSLLQHPSTQAHLNVEDSCYGWTPIHWAAQHGQVGIKLLLFMQLKLLQKYFVYWEDVLQMRIREFNNM